MTSEGETYGAAHHVSDAVHGQGLPHQAFDGDMNPYTAHGRDDDDAASASDGSEEELHEDKVLPAADEHGNQFEYPVDDGKPSNGESAPKGHSVIGSAIESIKYLYSLALLIFSIIVVMAAIFTKQTTATGMMAIPPVLAFFIFWYLICWLAMMEGGQGALVGLQPIDKALYAGSHPRSLKCTTLSHKGDNMERFIVGRQFLVCLVVFLLNMMSSSITGAEVLGLSQGAAQVFLANNVCVILITIMLGQLTGQVNASVCMLDYVNNYFMLFTTYVSLAIEVSGLLHSVYLVQIVFSKISGKPIDSKEPPRSGIQNLFFWGRVLMSTLILGYAFAVTLAGLFQGKTSMWKGVPNGVSVVLLFILMCFVGMMEGMQIALFAVVNLPEEEIKNHAVAHKTCQLAFRDQNLPSFLIGRQICVTVCMFVVARITSLNVPEGEPTIFGVSWGLQNFFNTGLLGALITTIVASLIWRVVASSFPIAFLSNPLVYLIIRLCLLLEKSGICSAAWVMARYHKPLVGYQPDEVHLENAEKHTAEPVTRRDKDIDRLVTIIKFCYSIALLIISVVLVMGAIFTKQTTATGTKGVPTVVAFIVFWYLICWLAMMEGGQGALVGLQPIEKSKYEESHPRTVLNTRLAHKGDNMERFILGRQFLVVLVVFLTNMMASSIPSTSLFGLPEAISSIFLGTGIALILITVMMGQLTAQVNAANCMLDFLNNYFMTFTIYVALFIEKTGLVHAVYLVQIAFAKITGQPVESKEPPKNTLQKLFFWVRVLISCAILGYAFAVTLSALFSGKTTMWRGVPSAVSVIVFFVLMCFVGMMEGMQIALFAVVNLPEEDLKHHTIAYANCQLTFRDQNLQAFLIGRQICVTVCMFVVARITTLNVVPGEGQNIFGVSDSIQNFFNTGLLGAVITTIVGSLAWRIIASSFPVAFLSNPLVYLIIRLCLLLEASGICSAAWVMGRFNKLLVGYQPDSVYLEGEEKHGKVPVTRRDKDIDITITCIKYIYSMVLLIFSVTLVCALIFSKQTKVSQEAPSLVAFFMIVYLLSWLGMMEGGQGCLVGLQPVEKELYADSHPVSIKCTRLAHKGDNMERFIIGRQFLVCMVVFLTNMAGAALPNSSVLGLPEIILQIFVGSGVAMILMTVILGQLTAQVNAANCMLDFINNYFMLFTTWVALLIEMTGLLHSVYLVQIAFSKISGKPIESKEPPRTALASLLFWLRVLVSCLILGYSFAVTLSALFQGKTTIWNGVPTSVGVIVFFVLMCFVGMMEGMQIALFAVVNMPKEAVANAPLARKTCELTFTGSNLQAFLIGRQICVTLCMFVVAKITSLNVPAGESTIFGVSWGLQNFFNTGLLGALITTIVGSLAWRIVASSFPIAFLSNPLVYLIIRLCLILEATGICSAAWLLALIHKQIVGYQLDEVYIGTAEERAAAKKEGDGLELQANA